MECVRPFSQLRTLHDNNLNRVANHEEAYKTVSNMHDAFSHCMIACVMHELQHGAARQEQVRIRPQAACVPGHKYNTRDLSKRRHYHSVCRGGPISGTAEICAAHHNGKLVAPCPELENAAHLR